MQLQIEKYLARAKHFIIQIFWNKSSWAEQKLFCGISWWTELTGFCGCVWASASDCLQSSPQIFAFQIFIKLNNRIFGRVHVHACVTSTHRRQQPRNSQKSEFDMQRTWRYDSDSANAYLMEISIVIFISLEIHRMHIWFFLFSYRMQSRLPRKPK